MLAEMIDKIVSLKETKTFEIGGHTYSDARLERIDTPIDRPRSIEMNSLDSLCKLILKERSKVGTTIMVQITGARTVKVMTTYLDDFSRNYLYEVKADVPDISNGYIDLERALVEIRSLFIPNDGTAYLLDLLGRMSKESNITTEDNGVTQVVEAKQGIALKANLPVKPRVSLKPFRTFLEVEQPESEFLLRVNDRGDIGLFEADGGVWKLEAKQNIADYLKKELSDAIAAEAVIVMK